MTDLPLLGTVPNVDIVAAGYWELSTGPVTFTTDDLADAIEAQQCPAVGDPVIKLGHTDPRFDGEPAVGHVANMGLTSEGNKITGDLADMPGWLAAVSASAYPERSIEGCWDFRCSIGHTHPFVITGLALLGVMAPGVGVLGTLQDVAALYGLAEVAAAKGEPGRSWRLTVSGGSMPRKVFAAGVTTEDVRRAYYEAADTPLSYWITEMQVDPPQLIVSDEASAKVYRVPVQIDGGTVTFGDAQEVEVEYVDIAAAGRKTTRPKVAAAYGGPATSRQGITRAAWDDAAAARLARLTKVRAAIGSYSTDEPTGALVTTLDDRITEATEAASGKDADAAAALDVVAAGETAAAHLIERLGLFDPDQVGVQAAAHGSFSGTHSHPHSAFGSQGDDAAHDHSHTHTGDGVHSHAHASQASGPTRKGASDVDFTDEQMTELRASLGLADDAELTADVVVSAAVELAKATATASAKAGRIGPDQMIVDKDAWASMTKRTERLEVAARAAEVAQRDEVIRDAIHDGKFSAASRQRYEKMWNADPDNAREIIASLRKNVVPVDDVGLAGGPLGEDLDAEYRELFPPSHRG